MDCDETQPLEEANEESSDSTDDESRGDHEPCAVLRVPCQGVFAGAEYKLSRGVNRIGRSVETCTICVPLQVLSKQHACIVVQRSSRGDLVYDLKSRNGTKRGKTRLEPDVRYELRHGDTLYFGGLECIYSRLDLPTKILESPFPVQAEASRVPVTGKLFDTSVECCSDSDVSVDMLQIAEDLIDPQDSLADAVDAVSSAAAVSPAVVRRTSVEPSCSSTPNVTRHGHGQSYSREQLTPKASYGDDDIYNMATQACTLPIENDEDETFHKLDDTIGPISDTVPLHHDEDQPNNKPGMHPGELTSYEAAQMAAPPHVTDNAEQDSEEVAIIQQAAHANVIPSTTSEQVDSSAPKPASSALALEPADSDNESTLLISDGEDADSKGVASMEAACRRSTENEHVDGVGSTADEVGLRTGTIDHQRPQRQRQLSTARRTDVATPSSGSLRSRSTARRKGVDGIPLPTPSRAVSKPSASRESLLQPRERIGAPVSDSFVASSSAEGTADDDDDDDKGGVRVSSTIGAMETSSDTALASCASVATELLSKSLADADTVPYNCDNDTAVSTVDTMINLNVGGDIGHGLSAATQQQQQQDGDVAAVCPVKECELDGSMPPSSHVRPVKSRSEQSLSASQELPVRTHQRQKATSGRAADSSEQPDKGDKVIGHGKRKSPAVASSGVLADAVAPVSGDDEGGVANMVDSACRHPAAHRTTRGRNSDLRKSDEGSRSCDVTPSVRATQNEQSSRKPNKTCSAAIDPVYHQAGRRSRAKVSDSAVDSKRTTARTGPGRRSTTTPVVDEGRADESGDVKLHAAATCTDETACTANVTCTPDRTHGTSNTSSLDCSTITSPRSKRARCNRLVNGGSASAQSVAAHPPTVADNEAREVPPDGGEPKDGCQPFAPANPRCSKRRTVQADDPKLIAPTSLPVAANHDGRRVPRVTAAIRDASPANKRARKTATSEAVVAAVPDVTVAVGTSGLDSRPVVNDAESGAASSSTESSLPDRGQQRPNRKTRPKSVQQAVSFVKAANETVASSPPAKDELACEAAEQRLRGAELPQRARAASAVVNTSASGRQATSRSKQASIEAPVPSRFPQVSRPKIMFTGISETEYNEMIKRLGGCVVDSVSQCTHLVTDEVRRTFKFLCAVARGIPIVTPQWLTDSSKSSTFLDATPFLLRDKAKEKLYGFALPETLERAQTAPLFKDFKVHATKSVKPPPEQIKEVVALAGGGYMKAMPKPGNVSPNTIIISCHEDVALCKSAAASGISVVTAEFLLTGILRHQVDTSAYALAL